MTHQRHIGDSPSTQVGSHVHFNFLLATLVSPQSYSNLSLVSFVPKPFHLLPFLSFGTVRIFPASPVCLSCSLWLPRAWQPSQVLHTLTHPVWNRDVVLVPSGPTFPLTWLHQSRILSNLNLSNPWTGLDPVQLHPVSRKCHPSFIFSPSFPLRKCKASLGEKFLKHE